MKNEVSSVRAFRRLWERRNVKPKKKKEEKKDK